MTKPILFSAPMVQAIIGGSKTQTRRVVKSDANSIRWNPIMLKGYAGFCDEHGNPVKPKYQTGDILWVRETWQYVDFAGDDNGYVYRATDPDWETMEDWKWKPSIFMPKEACRLFLKVTNVRVDKLFDISQDDAKAEGIESITHCQPTEYHFKDYLDNTFDRDAAGSFFTLWVKINGDQSFIDNPFVWVVEFEKTDKPENFKPCT